MSKIVEDLMSKILVEIEGLSDKEQQDIMLELSGNLAIMAESYD